MCTCVCVSRISLSPFVIHTTVLRLNRTNPFNTLDFKLSKVRYELAKQAKAETSESYWSHRMYNRPNKNGSLQEVKVHYCTSKETAEKVLKERFLGEPVLGFDMEWSIYAKRGTGPRVNTSLIQIGSPSNIVLLHIAMFRAKEDAFVDENERPPREQLFLKAIQAESMPLLALR